MTALSHVIRQRPALRLNLYKKLGPMELNKRTLVGFSGELVSMLSLIRIIHKFQP